MRILLLVPAFVFGLSCGDDTTAPHEHDFTNYAQCYNHHTEEEGYTPQDALDECDGDFADDTAFADEAACNAYYAQFTDIPTTEAEAHCTALFSG